MSESLRNDGRVWVPKERGDDRDPRDIPEDERDYYLERIYPAFGNLVPRDIASRQAKNMCDEGRGVGPGGLGVYLDFADAIAAAGPPGHRGQVRQPLRHVRPDHGRGPLRGRRCGSTPPSTTRWAACGSTTTCSPSIPGMFVIGEANFSDQGANRLGASALMQGLADGYFVLPATISDYLAARPVREGRRRPPGRGRGDAERAVAGRRSCSASTAPAAPASFHRELGRLMWDLCGMERSEESLRKALDRIPEIRQEFWTNVKVSGDWHSFNQTLEHAGRVADFIELAELMCIDALHRDESCGGHFRAESQTARGRGAARRRELRLRRRLGVDAGRASRRCCTRKPSSTSTSTSPSGATSDERSDT